MKNEAIKSMPKGYIVCLHSDCPKASQCLRYLAYEEQLKTKRQLTLMNPNQCTKGDDCPNYRDCAPVRFAYGFTNMQQKMFPKQYDQFKNILTNYFGHTIYFERRRGDSPLSPEEQNIIKDTLRKVGVQDELDFDRYKEQVYWKM